MPLSASEKTRDSNGRGERNALSVSSGQGSKGGLRMQGCFKHSLPEKPLLTIITVVYNGVKNLEQTIQSVLTQDYDNVEYIIIDGGSSDGTIDLIKKYEDGIDYWVSEPDKGIYDAMNKGVGLATGDYVAFINADDWYEQGALSQIVNVMTSERTDFIFGNVALYENEKYARTFRPVHAPERPRRMPFGHPSLFVKRALMEQYPFDLSYPTAADYDFVCKLLKKRLSFLYLDQNVANFRLGGISSSDTSKELFSIQKNHFGLLSAIYSYIRFSRNPFLSIWIRKIAEIKRKLFPFKDGL
jgi:glycosyltransferase involved in cell wall biosynthesis